MARQPTGGEGEWAGTRWHLVHRDSVTESETVVDGQTIYERSDDRMEGGEMTAARWSRKVLVPYQREALLDYLEVLRSGGEGSLDEIPFMADYIAVLLAATVYLDGGLSPSDGIASGFSGDPRGFLHVIEQMADAEVAAQTGDTVTLAKTLTPPADVGAAYGSELPEGQAELDVDAAGEPVALRLDLARGVIEVHIAVEFSDWNEPVEIAVPSQEEVDDFPGVDEPAIRDATTNLVLHTPTSLAEDWTVHSMTRVPAIHVVNVDVDPSLRECPAIQIVWNRHDSSGRFLGDLLIIEFSKDCALRSDPTPFEPGGLAGLLTRQGWRGRELLIGDTVLHVSGSLDRAELEAVLASLQPADIDVLMAEVEGP